MEKIYFGEPKKGEEKTLNLLPEAIKYAYPFGMISSKDEIQ